MEYFKPSEFACPCCKVVKVSPDLIEKLNELREAFGKPLVINSGYRCVQHNKAVGGARDSSHLTGEAVDINIHPFTGKEKHKLLYLAIWKFSGVGIAKSFFHFDVRPEANKALWVY